MVKREGICRLTGIGWYLTQIADGQYPIQRRGTVGTNRSARTRRGRKFQEKKDYSEKGAYRKRRLVSSGAARLTQSDVARRKKLKGRE